MPVERQPINPITDREQWLAMRKQDVTASRVGALFGAHPYVTALKLYLEKSGVEFPEQETAVMRRGRLMEGAAALACAEERPQWTINKSLTYYRDTDLRLGATPDFLIEGDPRGRGILQTKTASPSVFEKQWDGGKSVPFWIILQTLTEMMLTNAAFGAVAVIKVDAFDLACSVIDIARHPPAEQTIIDAVKRFWDDVANGREPGPDYGKDADLLRYLAPRAAKDKIVNYAGDNELPSLLEQRATLMEKIKAEQARCDEIETQIKFKMRDAERITGLDGWSITWKNQHRDEFIMPAKDFRVFRIHDQRGST
jgi:predicted phage-related endonuclease